MSKRTNSFEKPDRYTKPNEITQGELKANAFFSGLCIVSIIVFIIPKIILAIENTEGLSPIRYSDIEIWWSFWLEPIFILLVLIVSIPFLIIRMPPEDKRYRKFCFALFALNAFYIFNYLITGGMNIPESEDIPIFSIIGIIILWVFFGFSVYGIIRIVISQQESKKVK